jgi:hypothetical protein
VQREKIFREEEKREKESYIRNKKNTDKSWMHKKQNNYTTTLHDEGSGEKGTKTKDCYFFHHQSTT